MVDKVRVNSTYTFEAYGLDIYDSRTDLKDGERVKVVHKHGCPPANTMRHCYVNRVSDGKFAGLVLTASLKKEEK